MFDFCSKLGGGTEENNGMDKEFWVDYHVAQQNSDRVEKPTMKADHQHCWHVQQKMAYCDQKAGSIENIFVKFISCLKYCKAKHLIIE